MYTNKTQVFQSRILTEKPGRPGSLFQLQDNHSLNTVLRDASAHPLQMQWGEAKGGKHYFSLRLYDGVRWYYTQEDGIMWFEIVEPAQIKLGSPEVYNSLAGKGNARSWREWNACSVRPFQEIEEDEAGVNIPGRSDTPMNEERDRKRAGLAFRIRDNLTKRTLRDEAAGECDLSRYAEITEPAKVNFFKIIEINKALAAGNVGIITVLMEKEPTEEEVSLIKAQFKGFVGDSIPDVQEDIAIGNILKNYTQDGFADVTAYVRGSVWKPGDKAYGPAGERSINKGKDLLNRLDSIWDQAPPTTEPVTWRTEQTNPGELSRMTGSCVKGNPMSTSIHPIYSRLDKKENSLLRIINSKIGQEEYKQPVDVRKYSIYTEEAEVLYPAGTKYVKGDESNTISSSFPAASAVRGGGADDKIHDIVAVPPLKET